MILINDKNILNIRYRSGIMRILNERGVAFIGLGVFDNFTSFTKILYFILFTNKNLLSSNMKSNLLCLVFFWRSGTIIINGLGRYKRNVKFRNLLRVLFKLNSKKNIVFQNYSDYRYFSLFLNRSFYWVPGSGGIERVSGSSDGITIVSRMDKIVSCKDSILSLVNSIPKDQNIYIVGCNKSQITELFNHKSIIGCGYVDQLDIFMHSNHFFNPSGYGEGVPHALVDAICSSIEIILPKKDYISFGFYKLGFGYSELVGGFVQLIYGTDQSCILRESIIAQKYLDIVDC